MIRERHGRPALGCYHASMTKNRTDTFEAKLDAYAELLVSEMRIPHGVTPQQFEEERDNLLMRRVYSLGRHHILKTLLAQEARRKGIVLSAEEVAAK